LFDLDSQTNQTLLGISADEGKERMSMQQQIREKEQAEELRRQQFEQDRAAQRAKFEADQLSANQQQQIAQTQAPKGKK
jgi:hypothetical protein